MPEQPLSEHEQRILEEIEQRLAEEDPRLARAVTQTSLSSHLARRIRIGVLTFLLGFVMLLFFFMPGWGIWAAIGGFGVMLASLLVVYRYLKQMGQSQLRSMQRGGKLSLTSYLAKLAERFRGNGPPRN